MDFKGEYEYGGVDNCGKCRKKQVPVVEYLTGGFACFACAGAATEEWEKDE